VRQYYLEREAIAVELINRKKGNGAKPPAEDQALRKL